MPKKDKLWHIPLLFTLGTFLGNLARRRAKHRHVTKHLRMHVRRDYSRTFALFSKANDQIDCHLK